MSSTNNTTEAARSRASAARVSDLMRRASSLAERGMYEEAIAHVEKAIAICPHEPRCSLELANLYRAQNRFVQAIEAIRRAVELDPLNTSAQEQLMQILVDLGRYDEAIAAGRRLLGQFPKNLYARDVLGIAYVQQGRLDKALEVTNELIRLAPSDPAHHFKKAVLMQQKGEVAHAMAEFLRVVELDPDGDMAEDAREAIGALDGYQLRQVLTIAIEDLVFRTKLTLDPESASRERGFLLSSAGIAALRQIDIDELPGEARNRFYH